MQIELDDADTNWARPGVYQVADRVFRIPLPLPHAGLRAVNAYALADDGGLVLVDSGWGLEAARETLDEALAALDRRVADVRRFLVTHLHRDHYGLAVALRREFGQTVSLGDGERPSIEILSEPTHKPMGAHAVLLARWGAGPLVDWLRARWEDSNHDPADWAPPDDWLTGGSDVTLPARTLRVVATPGHTRGHVVFVDEHAGLLFAGDHVLPHTTPSIGIEVAPADLDQTADPVRRTRPVQPDAGRRRDRRPPRPARRAGAPEGHRNGCGPALRRRITILLAGACLLRPGDREVLTHLDRDALPVGGDEVGLVHAVGVGLDPLDRGAGILRQRGRLDLLCGVAGEQGLVGPLALGLIPGARRMVLAGRSRRGRRGGRGRLGGVGDRAGGEQRCD